MFQIILYSNADGEIQRFSCKGHAGYQKDGVFGDVVCSAISVLVLNTINSIERLTEDRFSCDTEEIDGKIDFQFESNPSKDSCLLLNAMIIGLQSIAEQEEYEDFIDLTFEEV